MDQNSVNPSIYARLFPVRNRKGNETKMRLVQAAVECIAFEGVENMTFESVGKRIGVTPTQVRYHFNDKADLIARAIDFVFMTLQEFTLAKMPRAKDWRSQVKVMVNQSFRWADAHPEQGATYLLFYYLAGANPRYRTMHTQMHETGQVRMEAILAPAKAEFHWSDDRLRDTAMQVWSVIDANLMYHLTTDDSLPSAMFRKHTLRVLEELWRE